MLFAIAFFVFVIIVALNWFLGMWNCLINLINFFIAALVASSSFELVAWKIENSDSSYNLLADFISVWLVFVVTFVILRGCTDMLSRYRLQVDPVLEMIGRSVFSVWLAGGFVCFMFFTLHMAPLPPQGFQPDLKSRVIGIGPDRFWLAFIQSRSRGALSEAQDSQFLPQYDLYDHPDDQGKNARVFDPDSRFLHNNFARRRQWADQPYLRSASQ